MPTLQPLKTTPSKIALFKAYMLREYRLLGLIVHVFLIGFTVVIWRTYLRQEEIIKDNRNLVLCEIVEVKCFASARRGGGSIVKVLYKEKLYDFSIRYDECILLNVGDSNMFYYDCLKDEVFSNNNIANRRSAIFFLISSFFFFYLYLDQNLKRKIFPFLYNKKVNAKKSIMDKIKAIRNFTLFLSLFLANTVYSQISFEGIVTYKVTFRNPKPQMIPDSIWKKKLGADSSFTQTYYYKRDKFKNMIRKSNESIVQLFEPHSQKIYQYKLNSDTAYWANAVSTDNPIKAINVNEKKDTLMGVLCNSLIITTDFYKSTYFFSKKYYIDENYYKNHLFGEWYPYLQKSHSIPLKIIMQGEFLNVEYTAIKIEEVKLKDDVFNVPKFKVQKESLRLKIK